MRRQHFNWTFLVLAAVLTIYGGYILFNNLIRGNPVPPLSVIFLVIGSIMFIFYLVLFLLSYFQKKNNPEPTVIDAEVIEKAEEKEEIKSEEIEEKPAKTEPKEEKRTAKYDKRYSSEVVYERRSSSSSSSRYDSSTTYVKLVGYGPILRVSGPRIVDMRTNTYYRIEGGAVYQDGYGQIYEISGNRIRSAFGSYLYEISGSNINKTFGGFYASISGNMIKKFDGSEIYEMDDSLSRNQLLVVVALIFGNY